MRRDTYATRVSRTDSYFISDESSLIKKSFQHCLYLHIAVRRRENLSRTNVALARGMKRLSRVQRDVYGREGYLIQRAIFSWESDWNQDPRSYMRRINYLAIQLRDRSPTECANGIVIVISPWPENSFGRETVRLWRAYPLVPRNTVNFHGGLVRRYWIPIIPPPINILTVSGPCGKWPHGERDLFTAGIYLKRARDYVHVLV